MNILYPCLTSRPPKGRVLNNEQFAKVPFRLRHELSRMGFRGEFTFPGRLNYILLILFSLAFHGVTYAQTDTINQFDQSGKRTGYWRVLHGNGNIRYEGYFSNDMPVGEFTRYYPGGIIQAEMTFSHDGRVSYATINYENGRIAAQGKYIGQDKDSVWNYFSRLDGHLTMKENYLSGKRHGESIKYYRNNQISEVITYKDDQKHGNWEKYFENGVLRLRSAYEYDKREGSFETWTSQGIPSVKGNYKDGIMHGEWIYYDDNGETEIIAEYVNGVLLPNEEIERRQEEFSRRVEESIGNQDEPEIFKFR